MIDAEDFVESFFKERDLSDIKLSSVERDPDIDEEVEGKDNIIDILSDYEIPEDIVEALASEICQILHDLCHNNQDGALLAEIADVLVSNLKDVNSTDLAEIAFKVIKSSCSQEECIQRNIDAVKNEDKDKDSSNFDALDDDDSDDEKEDDFWD